MHVKALTGCGSFISPSIFSVNALQITFSTLVNYRYESSASYQPVSSGVNSYLVSSTTEAGGYNYEFVDTNLPDVCSHEMVNLVMCSNGCGFKCKQNKLYKHLQNTCPKRIVSCEYCHKEDEYQIINGDHHYKECPDYPLYCPNTEKKIKRRLMTQHGNTCPKCNKKMKREDMPQHNKENVMIERYSSKIPLGFIGLFVVLILASTYLRIPIILLMIFALVVILTKFGNTQE